MLSHKKWSYEMESQAPVVKAGKSGIYSLVASVFAILTFVLAGFVFASNENAVGALGLVSMIASLAGIVFGIIALVTKQSQKALAIVGLILGLVMAAAYVAGIVTESKTAPAASEAAKE